MPKEKKQLTFKRWFVNLCSVNSCISHHYLVLKQGHTRLNWTTVRLYHQLHGTGK